MSRPTTKLSVIDIIRTHFPGLVVETTAQTIASGVTAYQIIGGQKPPGKRPNETPDKPPSKPS